MSKIILITQRLQKDYISYIHEDANLPCSLHVGPIESLRLMGTDSREGILPRFLKALYSEKTNNIEVIHIIEEHNLADPEQGEEIKIFGIHCVEKTSGVEPIPVIKLRDKQDPFTKIIKSKGKNDFYSSTVKDAIEKIIGKTHLEDVHVFIIGVRTELNIRYLIYDIKYRLGIKHISTCSLLTTTTNRRLHFETLEHFKRTFGIKVYDRVDTFYRALGLENFTKSLIVWDDSKQTINFSNGSQAIFKQNNDLKNIIKIFFADSKDVTLNLISSDQKDVSLFSVTLMDWKFRKSEKYLLRIGKADIIAREKRAIEMVEIFLPPNKPVMVDYIDIGEWAGILYGFNKELGLNTFKNFYGIVKTNDQLQEFNRVVDEIMNYLRRLHKRSQSRKAVLGDYYDFRDESFISAFEKECNALLGHIPNNEYITLKNFGLKIINPLYFFKNTSLKNIKIDCHFGVTHGNLIVDNIVFGEDNKNIYLINYNSFEEGLVLDDIARLEIDVKFLTEVTGQIQLSEFISFEQFLLSSENLQIKSLPDEFISTQYRKLYETIKRLRIFTDFITFGECSSAEYLVALIKHTCEKLIDERTTRNIKVFSFISLGLMIESFIKEIR